MLVFCSASAQVACLGGDFAGSWMRGPDGLSQDIHVVRHEGYGAYAHSMSEGATYVVTGSMQKGWPVSGLMQLRIAKEMVMLIATFWVNGEILVPA